MTNGTSDAEEKDLVVLRKAIQEKKDSFYSMAETIDRADAHTLETMGHRGETPGEAIHSYFKRYQREIKKLCDAHTKKYPD